MPPIAATRKRPVFAELHGVKWPDRVPVITEGPTTTYAFAGNTAQVPNSAGPVWELYGDDLFVQILCADGSRAPDKSPGTTLIFLMAS